MTAAPITRTEFIARYVLDADPDLRRIATDICNVRTLAGYPTSWETVAVAYARAVFPAAHRAAIAAWHSCQAAAAAERITTWIFEVPYMVQNEILREDITVHARTNAEAVEAAEVAAHRLDMHIAGPVILKELHH